MNITFLGESGALAAIIIFLIGQLKNIEAVNSKKWALPLIAFLLGAVGGYVGNLIGLIQPPLDVLSAITAGIGVGATATGLYTAYNLAGK